MGVVAWYYNEYFVEEPAHNWELDLEETTSRTKRKGQCSSSTGTKSKRRNIREKDEIVASIKKVAESLKQLSHVINDTLDEKDIEEVVDEVKLIPDLDKQEWAKAVKLLANDLNQLVIMRALPIQKKKDYILAFIS